MQLRARDQHVVRCCVLLSGWHNNRAVDLELNGSVSSGECSWWRLEGYDTFNDDGEDEEPMLRHAE